MTILHIGPSPTQVGGMETFVGDLFNSSLAQKHTLILLDSAKPRLRRFGRSAYLTGYSVFKRNVILSVLSYAYSLKFLITFIFLLCRKRIDIIHIHTASYTSFWEKCLYINIAKLTGKKIVLHIHGALFKEFYNNGPALSQKLIAHHLNQCDAVIVLSKAWKTFFSTIIEKRKLFVIENGINLSPFLTVPDKSSLLSFLHMGEVSQRKGIYDLLRVIEILKAENRKCHFDIVGPGELDAVSRIIDEINIGSYITLHGPHYGAARFNFFERAHCFVLPSYAEGFPIAMIEALAAGLPILSTTVGGIPDMIQQGVHGFLCAPGDIETLAGNIKKMIVDPELREKISRTNRIYAFDHFNIHRCAEKIAAVYFQLCV